MKALVGLGLGVIFMLIGLVLGGGHVASILQLEAFFLVLGVALGMTLLGASWHQIVSSYSDSLKGKLADPKVFRTIGINFLNAGLLGAFVGFVQMVRYLRLPDQIGPALALSVVSILYGFLGYLIFGLGFEASVAGERRAGDSSFSLKKTILPIALVILAVFGSLHFGLGSDQLTQFANIPAALVVAAGILMVYGFIRGFRRSHLPYLANGALASGVIGCIFNLIHVMENLDKPDAIFVGLSVALLPMLYATLISLTIRSISDRPDDLLASDHQTEAKPQTLVPHYLATASVLFVSTALVMYAIRLPSL